MRETEANKSIEYLKNTFDGESSEEERHIEIKSDLKGGLPNENINKIAGPVVEKWAQQVIEDRVKQEGDKLIKMEEGARLDFYDIMVQIDGLNNGDDIYIDVKSTAGSISSSGKSPNITSFAVVRNQFLEDSNTIFLILDFVFDHYKKGEGKNTADVIEVSEFSLFDLIKVSESDLNYNPALGTGQVQIRDIRDVSTVDRTVEEFIEYLDQCYINSNGIESFKELAEKHDWDVDQKDITDY